MCLVLHIRPGSADQWLSWNLEGLNHFEISVRCNLKPRQFTFHSSDRQYGLPMTIHQIPDIRIVITISLNNIQNNFLLTTSVFQIYTQWGSPVGTALHDYFKCQPARKWYVTYNSFARESNPPKHSYRSISIVATPGRSTPGAAARPAPEFPYYFDNLDFETFTSKNKWNKVNFYLKLWVGRAPETPSLLLFKALMSYHFLVIFSLLSQLFDEPYRENIVGFGRPWEVIHHTVIDGLECNLFI